MSTKALSLSNAFSINFSARRTSSRTFLPSRPWVSIASAALVLVNLALLVSYLVGVNGFATKGYEIKQLQNTISRLTEENSKYSVQTAEASSMAAIQNSFEQTGFVPALSATYLQTNQYSQR